MSVKEFAQGLKQTLEQLRSNGITEIKSDDLITYLEQVIASPGADTTHADMERYKAGLQLVVEQNKGMHASQLEMFKSVITAGQNALRTSFLMNGGATVAILAFLGKLSEQHHDKIPVFSASLVVFVGGVLAITAASGCTYLGQWFYAGSKEKSGFWLNVLSILLGLSSYGFFIWGSARAYIAFGGFA